jgi:hypothetical protein
MAIDTMWYLESKVLLVALTDNLTLEDARQHVAKKSYLLANHPNEEALHIIYDLTRLAPFENRLKEVNEALRFIFSPNAQSQIGWLVLVGSPQSRVTQYVLQSAMVMFGLRGRFFDSITEALAFLNQNDPTLPPLNE